jgi:hypothetical protein
MLTIKITGCNSPEKFDQVKECLLEQDQLHRNLPVLYVDLNSRERAHSTLTNLNLLPGIKAEIVQDQYEESLEARTSR